MIPKDDPNSLTCHLEENGRVVVIGIGGIGGALLPSLALFLNSFDVPHRLVLVDGDEFEPKNAQRQMFQSLGNKARVKAAETVKLLGESCVTVVPVADYITPENIGNIIKTGDIVFLCVDNHPTRKLVSEHWQTLSDVILFSGGNEGINPPHERGTYGNVQIAVRRNGENVTVPITRYHPEITETKEKLPHELSCGQLVASTPQILFTNFAVASAMLNAYFGQICDRLHYQEVKVDILDARMLPQFPLQAQLIDE
jgi:hypothetical protein